MPCCGRGKPAPVPQNPQSPAIRATPDARYWAARLGIDLTQVRGTGRDGLIRKEDVEAVAHG